MSILAQVAMPFSASASGASSGLVGTIGVQVVRGDGSVAVARTTADIIELVPGSGVYWWTCAAAPTVPGEYEVVWDTGLAPDTFASEDLIVGLGPVITSGGSGAPPYPTIGTVRAQAQQAQRAVRGREFTASYTFGLDGDALPDADTTVSVSIVNAEGYLVVSDVVATLAEPADDGTQVASIYMAASTTPQRDALTCLWGATITGAAVSQISTVDVCDARLYPLSDYLQYPELSGGKFTPAQLEAQRMWAEDRIEWECGCAFTGRYATETFTLGEPPELTLPEAQSYGGYGYGGIGGRGRGGAARLVLEHQDAQALRSITQTTLDSEGDTTITTIDLAYARLNAPAGEVLYRDPLGAGLYGDVVVGFEYGHPEPDVRRVALILARYRLLNGPLDSRATSMAVDGGTIQLLTPGVAGSVFGIPEVDAFIQRHNKRALGFVSAAR